jgi:ubiquinone/menaquinone biosynthesis C-methylase UbiE
MKETRVVENLVTQAYGAFALLAGMELDLFSPLADGPLSALELADALGGVDPVRLHRLCRTLAGYGLLTAEAGGRFALTAETTSTLVKGQPAYRGSAASAYAEGWRACLETSASIRNHGPAAALDFSDGDPARTVAVLRGLAPQAVAGGKALLKHLDFSGIHRVLDIAGGSGALSATICEAHAHLTATIVELPDVAPHTRTLLDEQPGGAKIELIAGDAILGPLPGGFDLAVMRCFLQLFGPEQIVTALRTARTALAPNGQLAIIGYCLTDDEAGPALALGADLLFLNYYTAGAAYRLADYRAWLKQTGFAEPRLALLGGGMSLLIAKLA